MQRALKCPKCRTMCIAPVLEPNKSPSVICLADHSEARTTNLSDSDFKLRIWSYMAPPEISGPIPAVNPERLEMVRSMLDGASREKPLKTRIDSNITLDFFPDGSIRKTTSHVTTKNDRATTSRNMQSCEPYQVLNFSETTDMTFDVNSSMSSTRHNINSQY